MLLCARTREGMVNRRGCVGLMRRTPDGLPPEPPLFFPRMYDDIECPCLVQLEGTFYLIGSIREDVEVHYWWCESFLGEYRSFNDNMLMPRGNYAARIMRDGDKVLIYHLLRERPGRDQRNPLPAASQGAAPALRTASWSW